MGAVPQWLLLALITALGAALRLHHLDDQSLGNDELSSWTQYRLASLWETVAHVDRLHPPGYWILMHFWVGAFGDSEAMLRLPSALAGIAAIPAMYALGKRLFGPFEGLIAAAITATAWTPLYFSQAARAYSFLFLWVVLSSYWLIDIVRALRQQRPLPIPALVGYVLAAELACYFHHFGLLFTGLQAALVGLLLLFLFGRFEGSRSGGTGRGQTSSHFSGSAFGPSRPRRPEALLRLGAIYGIVLLGYLPCLGRALTVLAGGPGWLSPPTLADVLRFVRSLFSDSTLIAAAVVGLWATLLARIIMTRRRVRSGSPASAEALLFLWLLAPLAIVYAWSHLVSPAFNGRYLIIVAPAAYLLLARAVTRLPIRPMATAAVATLVPVVLLLQLVVVQEYFTRPSKEQFRDTVGYLMRHDAPGTDTLILASAWNRDYFNYYLERLGSARRVDRLAEAAGDRAMIAQLIETRSPDAVWLLAGHKQPAHELVAWLTDELRLVGEAHFVAAHVWHFVPRGSAPEGAADQRSVPKRS